MARHGAVRTTALLSGEPRKFGNPTARISIHIFCRLLNHELRRAETTQLCRPCAGTTPTDLRWGRRCAQFWHIMPLHGGCCRYYYVSSFDDAVALFCATGRPWATRLGRKRRSSRLMRGQFYSAEFPRIQPKLTGLAVEGCSSVDGCGHMRFRTGREDTYIRE